MVKKVDEKSSPNVSNVWEEEHFLDLTGRIQYKSASQTFCLVFQFSFLSHIGEKQLLFFPKEKKKKEEDEIKG